MSTPAMTGLAYGFLLAAAAAAVVDWVAVAASRRHLEYAAKPAVMLALTLHPASGAERSFVAIAVGFGLVSDVFLMLPRDLFLAGLGAALFEHASYIAGFRTRDVHVAWLLAALAAALISSAALYPPIHRALSKGHAGLVGPVVLYLLVFAVMVASAGGTGSPTALAGALLFFYSDAILAWDRFVKPLPRGRLANIVPYHVGEALLVLSLLD